MIFNRLTVPQYAIRSVKIHQKVRLAFLTDLHSCRYGKGQGELLDILDDHAPDLVLLGGDIQDDSLPPDNTLTVLEYIGGRWPSFYVSGNHEWRRGKIEWAKEAVASRGVHVLAGDCLPLTVGAQTLEICGVDDPAGGREAFFQQLEACAAGRTDGRFGILISHRPERIGDCLPYGFDLVLSGHAHGGQWRLPGIINGLYAPGQGLFPKYAGGEYRLGETTLLVSRGLARESTPLVPRLFNPPELVITDLLPR